MRNVMEQPVLLALDDDREIGKIVEAVARQVEFDTTVTDTAHAFYERLRVLDPDVVVLDLQVPEMDGVELLRRLADAGSTSAIILATGMDRRTIASATEYARKRGLNVVAALQKPFLPEELSQTLSTVRGRIRPLDASDLERAIENDELVLHYQPAARRACGAWHIDSVEALLRWEHPERGMLMPDAFLRLGEDQGLSRAMTDFVIQKGLEQLKGWYARNLRVGLRINLSAALITDIEFPDRLQLALGEFEMPGRALTLEINETAMLSEHPETFDILTRLRLKEIGLAIDDFGIGYSSLTQLFRMPFSEMKIDKSLTQQIPESAETRTSIEALIDLAHKLGLSVCAEGVERKESLEFLAAVECDSIQGFYVSPPLLAKSLPDAVDRWTTEQNELVRAADRGPRLAEGS